MLITLLILGCTLFLFITSWLRLDLVALMMLLALLLTEQVTTTQALAGFSDPVVIMIAALFVVGGAILHSGTAQALGSWVAKLTGTRESAILSVLILAVALLSGFMSSTGTVAVFLPIAIMLARQAGFSPARVLMPMAFAAFLGGMLTLIGTPPNLVVSNTLAEAGLEGFSFFDFTLPGLAALGVAYLFLILPGRWLLPQEAPKSAQEKKTGSLSLSVKDLLNHYEVSQQLLWLRLPPGSFLYGGTLQDLRINERFQLQILCSRPGESSTLRDRPLHFCCAETQLQPHEDILVLGDSSAVQNFIAETGAVELRLKSDDKSAERKLGLGELMLLPRSTMMGKTLSEFRFRERFRLHVLAVQRNGKIIRDDIGELRLRFADFLLVQGPWDRIERLQHERREFTVLNLPHEFQKAQIRPVKIVITLSWLGAMIAGLIWGALPAVTVILCTAVGLVLSHCLSTEEAYRSISWESVILIAAMLPMATALENSGATQALSEALGSSLKAWGPYTIMASLFVLTSVCSLFLSNTATTVLIAPVALQLAQSLGYSPHSFLMVVALGASSAFSTPISSPVNTMVLAPGGYRFVDYLKLGLPLQVLMLIVTLIVVPLVFGL